MSSLSDKLKEKLTQEDYDFALQILSLPTSKIRSFLEDKVKEVVKD
ncbi:MAG: hypothetical protein QXX95_01460 [Nitrososphaerales archaeon]